MDYTFIASELAKSRYLRHLSAPYKDDLIQDVLVHISSRFANLPPEDQLRMAFVRLRYSFLDHHRKIQSRSKHESAISHHIQSRPESESSPVAETIEQETKEQLKDAIDHLLSEDDKYLIHEYFYGGFRLADIAAKRNQSIPTVSRQLTRIVKMLGEILGI